MKGWESNSRLLIVAAILMTAASCAPLGIADHKCCHQPAVIGQVTTGGPFAVARVIPIPSSGLRLGDAVEMSLRPGIASPAIPATAALQQNAAPPVGQMNIPFPTMVAGALDQPTIDKIASNVETFVTNNKYLPKTNTDFDQRLRALLTAAQKQKVVANPGVNLPATTRKKLRGDLVKSILALTATETLLFPPTAITSAAVDPTAVQLDAACASILRIFGMDAGDPKSDDVTARLQKAKTQGVFRKVGEDRWTALQALVDQLDLASAPAPTSAVVTTVQDNTAQTVANNLAVVRTLPTGRQFVIPLQFVRTYIPGDMLLADGDRVEIVSMDATPAGTNSNAPSGLAVVTSWGSTKGLAVSVSGAAGSTVSSVVGALENASPADVIILRRIGNNGLIDYWLPAQDLQRLSNVYVQPADLVRFDFMELTPQIIASRRFASVYSALSTQCAAPHGSLLASLPIISWFTGSSGNAPSITGSTQGVLNSLQRGTDPITGVSTNDVMTHLQQLPTAVQTGAQSALR